MPDFPQRIKQLRLELDDGRVSQNDLVKRLGVFDPAGFGKLTSRTVSDWERGFAPPRFANFLVLARFFDVSLDYLAGWTDDRGRAPSVSPAAPSGQPNAREGSAAEASARASGRVGGAQPKSRRQSRRRDA